MDWTVLQRQPLARQRNTGGSMKRRFFAIAIAAICMTWGSLAYSQQDSEAVVAKLAEETATNICGDVPDSGWKAGAELSASASVDPNLSRFINKVIKANVAGTAKLGGNGYVGPLQADLGKVRADTQNCKLEVAMKLIEYVEKTQAAANVPQSERIQVGTLHLVPAEPSYPDMKAEPFARRWLTLMEEGRYRDAYKLYDPAINSIVTEETWEQQAKKLLTGCFPTTSRTIDLDEVVEGPSSSQPQQNEWAIAFKTVFKGGKTYSDGGGANEKVGIILVNGRWAIREYTNTCAQAMNDRQDDAVTVKPQPPEPEVAPMEK
jgi:hypothetical protein